MKSVALLLLSALLIIAGCTPPWYNNSSHPGLYHRNANQIAMSGAIKVECQKERSVSDQVKLILKSAGHVADWVITDGDYYIFIEARYDDLSDGKAQEINEQLNEMFGVKQVEIRRDIVPGSGQAKQHI